MRNMSFSITTQPVRNRTKTVTRRLGWWFLSPGDIVMACVKCRGLRKGEKIERITPIRILRTYGEPLNKITKEDCTKEGFPYMEPTDFIEMFCTHNKCDQGIKINRIEFEYVDLSTDRQTEGNDV